MKNLLSFIALFLTTTCFAATLEVGKNKPYSSIKSAIAAAAPGDVVMVHAGTYSEGEIVISKSLRLIGIDWPILDGQYKFQVLLIDASKVLVEGFEVKNGGYSSTKDWAAIKIADCSDVTIRNNKLTDNAFGIYLQNASWCIVDNNIIKGKAVNEVLSGNAIHCWKSNNLKISNNNVSGHRDGIYFEFVTNSVIQNNNSFENLRYGLHFMFSHQDIYMYNTFRKNGAGVAVMYSKQVHMISNHFEDNWGSAAYGILLKEINDGEVKYNTFTNNTVGIYMEGTNRLNIHHNRFTSNGWAMRVQASCSDNTIARNNYFGNTFDVGTNGTVQLNHFTENYWDKYEGYDRNKDSFGDIPFQPVSLYSMVVERIPSAAILLRSFMVKIMDKAERIIPSITPVELKDEKPLMRPVKIL